MQNWNKKIQEQLNDLPGFPPVPTGAPKGTAATPYEWILGDWIDECHVRPEVADFAALPATGNEDGDVRMSRADESWFIWDATLSIWKPVGVSGGGVVSVTGIAPINVTPGVNPVVSHDASGAVAGTYGDASNVAQVTVDAKGHVTAATTVPISITTPIGALILSTGPVQTISANTDQITPVAVFHRIQTNGVNHSLNSTPQINLPGAVIGQVLFIHNVDTTGRHVTLQRGVAEGLSLTSAGKKIEPGGTMTLVYTGSLWVEVAFTEFTNT
jgi:hypothetical protein